MERKKVIVVDTNDRAIQSCDKLTAHQSPILHRAFSVFIVDGNKMLLQKRAKCKYHCGGLWTNACCSHPENENTMLSARTRINEELAIDTNLQEIFCFVYFAKFKNGLYEYEYDHTFLGNYSKENHINFDKNEIDEIMWIEFDELEKLLLDKPENFTPWFLHACPRILKYINQQY